MKTLSRDVPFLPASLSERTAFYAREFSLTQVRRWFASHCLKLPQLCALDAGTDTDIIKKKKWRNALFYVKFEELLEKITQYAPEDIYYDRNLYREPERVLRTMRFNGALQQELVFDVDAENIECENLRCDDVCERCLQCVYVAALELNRELRKIFHATALVYSGRGFHIHVLDKGAFFMSDEARTRLGARFAKKYPIDPWVTRGHIRLIRLPYSLHGEVSRVATPLDIKNKFVAENTIPKFLREKR